MIRRFGQAPSNDTRYRLRHGVYALLPLNGALLLTFQQEPLPEFQLPGGGVDAGESPLTALHREVFE
jgi:8-oxo-dGTP diphosphatase